MAVGTQTPMRAAETKMDTRQTMGPDHAAPFFCDCTPVCCYDLRHHKGSTEDAEDNESVTTL